LSLTKGLRKSQQSHFATYKQALENHIAGEPYTTVKSSLHETKVTERQGEVVRAVDYHRYWFPDGINSLPFGSSLIQKMEPTNEDIWEINFQLPFSALIVGKSQSGKTY